jgi:curved DNA-binding protein CbpA
MSPNGGSGESSPEEGASTETVELSSEFQDELRDLARALPGLNYYELLGVEKEADAAAIRTAFFERSKRFHPDRYFTKQIGPYGPLLTEIYKRVVAANDILRDPGLRTSYDRLLTEGGPKHKRRSPVDSPAPPADCPSSLRDKPPAPSLRDRKGLHSRQNLLQGLEGRLKKSRSKAKGHFEQAIVHKEAGHWERAATMLKHALAFDPRDQNIHDELAEVVILANATRAEEALSRGRAMLKRGEQEAAIEMLAEASQLRPTDAELATTVAELLRDDGKLKLAQEFAERAVSLEGDFVRALKVLGQILKHLGDATGARKNLQRAWELDPMDREIKAALQAL